MFVLIRTESNTIIDDGLEYSTYPPPTALVKVMKRCYAQQLITEGIMKFGSLETYRSWENAVLGDRNDGIGMFHLDGRLCTVGSGNPVYAWCASLPDVTPERIRLLASHGGYDCLVRIHQPRVLLKRFSDALEARGQRLFPHCAKVSYNKGEEVDKVTLNSQKFHFNVFQKDVDFANDREYRLSLTAAGNSRAKKHICLIIGNCIDIMEIEELPNNTL